MLTGWKTILFNGALVAVPVLDFLMDQGKGTIPVTWLLAIGAVGIVLRYLTTTPVRKSK